MSLFKIVQHELHQNYKFLNMTNYSVSLFINMSILVTGKALISATQHYIFFPLKQAWYTFIAIICGKYKQTIYNISWAASCTISIKVVLLSYLLVPCLSWHHHFTSNNPPIKRPLVVSLILRPFQSCNKKKTNMDLSKLHCLTWTILQH